MLYRIFRWFTKSHMFKNDKLGSIFKFKLNYGQEMRETVSDLNVPFSQYFLLYSCSL